MPRMSPRELKERLSGLFTAHGLEPEESARLAAILTETEAAGRRSHGLIRVRPMLNHLDRRGHRPGVWLRTMPVGALYDGRQGLGYLVAWHTAAKAAELAAASGIALAGARGCTHTGPIGYFAGMCARAGLVGMCFANCSPFAAPFGATEAVLGTNPVAFAFPRNGQEPLVVDFGTTAVTYGECRVAIAEGRSLPGGVALDSAGHPTTDPQAAIDGGTLLPFGAHKGYALALAVQVLTSAVIGSAAVPEPGQDYGLTVMAFKPDLLVSLEQYESSLEELSAAVHCARPADPARPVRLPGEGTLSRRATAVREGIDIPEALLREVFG
ncbi:Ldh family oxidoreductase [bacterium]|nr:Ldh family oxidoreductase [bacterium]